MDCCNYMQYRHHQPYYGSHCYDPLPAYHGDFYGQQAYQEYYGNPPYYPQQWPCAASFPGTTAVIVVVFSSPACIRCSLPTLLSIDLESN
jgi:hypothetical protein